MSELGNLEKIQKLIKDGETLQVRATERRNSLRPQYQKKIDEITALGFNPKNMEEDIKRKEAEKEKLEKEILAKIPVDIIEKFKNYDFASEKEEQPDMNLPF